MFSNYPAVRVGIYVLALAAQIAAVFVRIYNAPLADAFDSAANLLAAFAGATALSNITPAKRVYSLGDSENHLGD